MDSFSTDDIIMWNFLLNPTGNCVLSRFIGGEGICFYLFELWSVRAVLAGRLAKLHLIYVLVYW